MEADFSGYATRADIKCSDGRTITADAFKHQDKIEVPLVWQHQHDSPDNILGKAILEHRGPEHPEGAGIYCYGYFNDTDSGKTTKALVEHQDVRALSIYANGLVEKAKSVLHGAIREVSVVLSGANPGAFIDNIRLAHSDGEIDVLDDQAIIYFDQPLEHKSPVQGGLVHDSDSNDPEEIYNGLSSKEKEVVHFMIGAAVEDALGQAGDSAEKSVQHSENEPEGGEGGETTETGEGDEGAGETTDSGSDNTDTEAGDGTGDGTDTTTEEGDLKHQEGSDMSGNTRNVFEGSGAGSTMTGVDMTHRLTHGQLESIVEKAKNGMGFKKAVIAHAAEYGIDNIELLFPDAQVIQETPEFIARRMEWVASVLAGTKHSPFAAVKTVLADITKEEARAKGYVKGARKEEEVFELLARTTRPATIYKKQKLDRDDLLDITDVNVVSWLKAEMRLMIEEELARAILVGDNRPANHPDKVKDPKGAVDGVGIRSVLYDDDLYSIKTELPSNADSRSVVKGLVRAMDEYRGSGSPTMYISRAALTDMMLDEDRFGRPLYANRTELADKIGVGSIVTIDLFSEYDGLFAIIVSLSDYTIGSNKGGELTSFEDFDIDFNQYKYLQETRLSGGLTRPFSAIVVTRADGTLAEAEQPQYTPNNHTIVIPDVDGVVYTIDGDEVAAGNHVITENTEVRAEADDGYYLQTGSTRSWYYQY